MMLIHFVFVVISLDDPVMWGGFKGLLLLDPEFARWVLAAEDICFRNPIFSYIFRTGMLRFLVDLVVTFLTKLGFSRDEYVKDFF